MLDCVELEAYAVVDDDVSFTGRCGMHVDGKPLGPVAALAIGRNLPDGDILLLYCDSEWNSVAAGSHSSVAAAKAAADRAYDGIRAKWCKVTATAAGVAAYLDAEWPGCSFCGRRGYEVELMIGEGAARICANCVDRFHGIVRERAE